MKNLTVPIPAHTSNSYTNTQLSEIVSELIKFLNEYKVPYLVKCETNTFMPIGLRHTKYRTYANGVMIPRYMATQLKTFGLAN